MSVGRGGGFTVTRRGTERTGAGDGTGTAIQCVDRAVVILELPARDTKTGVGELADTLGVNETTAWRLLATLRQHHLVEQTGGRGKYRLGPGLLRLARAATGSLELFQEA